MGGVESSETERENTRGKCMKDREMLLSGLVESPKNPVVSAVPVRIVPPGYQKSEYMDYHPPRNPGYPIPVSPVELSFDGPDSVNWNVFERKLLGDVSHFPNYGVLPVEVIHTLLIFLSPKDLLSCILTCKLVSRVSKTSYFWKCYYHHYFKEKTDHIEMKVRNDSYNWKKAFFKRFSETSTDTSLRKKWNPTKMTKSEYDDKRTNHGGAHLGHSPTYRYQFRVLGKKGVGKRTFVNRLLERNERSESTLETREFYFETSPPTSPPSPPKGRGDSRNQMRRLNQIFQDVQEPSFQSVNGISRVIVSDSSTIDPQDYQTDGYILCFNLEDRSSFEYLKKNYVKTVKVIEGRKDGAMYEAIKGQHRYHCVVVGLRSDLCLSKRKVSREEVRRFVKMNNFKAYVEPSAKNGDNLFLPFGIILTKSCELRRKSGELTRIEMAMMPYKYEVKFDCMDLHQKIV